MLSRYTAAWQRGDFWARAVAGSALVFLATLAGRAAGFVRELILAGRLGVGTDADIAVIVFTFPDLLIALLIAGSTSTVLIPEFERLRARSPGLERRLAMQATWWAAGGAALVVLLVVAVAPLVVGLLGPGFSAEASARTSTELRIAAVAFPAFAVMAVLRAYLHHLQRFLLPSLAALLYNVIIATALFVAVGPGNLRPLALAVVSGAIFIALTHVAGSVRWSERGAVPVSGRLVTRALAGRYVQALVTGSAIAVLPFVARAAASTTGEGGVATYNFAMRLTELPNGTILAAISVPLFPAISRVLESDDYAKAVSLARRGAAVLFAGGLVVAVIVAAPAGLWADLVYLRGAVNAEDTTAIGSVTRILAFALPAQGLVPYLIYLFAARRDFHRPLVVTLAGLGFFAVFAFTAAPQLSVEGVALAFVAFNWLIAVTLVVMLGRIHGMPLLFLRP